LNESISRRVVIVNDLGMHARSAAKIAKLAQSATADIWLEKDGEQADATSIIDMLALACQKGTEISFVISDETDLGLLDAIVKLVESGFGE